MSLISVHSGYLPTMYGCFDLKMVFESFIRDLSLPVKKEKNGELRNNSVTSGILDLRLQHFGHILVIISFRP